MSDDLSGSGLIRGGMIIDGKGSAPFRADIRIEQGRITRIGLDLPPDDLPVYDATGCYISPGFIDSHTHYDASLFWDPQCDPIVKHGVTTVLIGNCGLGLAPIRKEDVGDLSALFSFIEDLPYDLFTTLVPWNWESFPEYAAEMRSRRYGVNVAALVSHSLLRTFVIGADAWKRASTREEADRIATLLREAMEAGAFGFSSSRFDRSPSGDLVPSFYADEEELDRLFDTTSACGGIVQMIPEMSDIERQEKDLRELADLSRRHGRTPVIFNQIYERPDNPEYHRRLQAAARDARAHGGNFHFLISPRSIDLALNFHQSMLFMYAPAWNEIVQPDLPREEKLRRLADPEWRTRARADWDAVKGGFPSSGMARHLRIVAVGRPEYEQYVGQDFSLILDQSSGHVSDILANWVIENDLDAELVLPFTNLDMDAVGQLLAAEETIISASDAGAHIGMFDGAGDTTLVLSRHVRDRGDLPLELAVKRMTGDQAKLLGLAGRGVIEEGAIADISVFDLSALVWKTAPKVNDVPGGKTRFRRPAGGFRYTFVNGVLAQQDGRTTGALAGTFLAGRDKVQEAVEADF